MKMYDTRQKQETDEELKHFQHFTLFPFYSFSLRYCFVFITTRSEFRDRESVQ